MSVCLATKFSGAAVGLATLAQVMPTDAASTAGEIYSRFGVVGLLVAVVVALWLDGKREQARAEERRAKRDEKDDVRHAAMIEALGEVKGAIRESSLKCDATREIVREKLGRG
jgi:hypothetical protein